MSAYFIISERRHITGTAEPLLSGLMTGCHWPDNQISRIIEDDLLMRPYVYVKTVWRITSYSTLFILKRNTGNCFYLLSYVCLLGIFLEKVHQKTLFRTTRFCLFTCYFLFGCRYTNGYRLTTPPTHWKCRGTAYRCEARLIEFTVNRSPDHRGSTVFVVYLFLLLLTENPCEN
jgi:hypothetical protein